MLDLRSSLIRKQMRTGLANKERYLFAIFYVAVKIS